MRIPGLSLRGKSNLFCLEEYWGSLTPKVAAGWLLEGEGKTLWMGNEQKHSSCRERMKGWGQLKERSA